MAESKVKTLTKDDAKAHLDKIEKQLEAFIGKAGYNPFIKLNEIKKLREVLNKPEAVSAAMVITSDCKTGDPVIIEKKVVKPTKGELTPRKTQ